MPVLDWLGKEKVINHHRDAPFHFLDKKFSVGTSQNKIIHGDNLLALKSLLPEFVGKVKCIYIDPPYNTGNEGWIYNDNVNSPQIRSWLGKVVGKEGEDLTRHDKWLCMMYPRLRLLQRLLSDDGAIFISIDDNEQANLKLICDEIFGANNFVAVFPWRKRTAKSDVPHGVSQDFESILCYAKTNLFQGAVKGKERKYFETDDFPNRPWRFHDLTKQTTAAERPNSFFTIVNPKTGEEFPANPNSTWRVTKDSFKEYYAQDRIIFPGDYPFLKISKPVLRYWKADDMKKAGAAFGMVAASTYLPPEIVGMSQDGTKEITKIFGEKKFNFPKPSKLIEHLIGIAVGSDKDSLILDSFAGSGTTAHAVINLNASDGGNRRFILIELMDYAESITAERVKRVGGNFNFYELGEPLFDDDGLINKKIPREKIFDYVYFSETGKHFIQGDEKFLLGVDDNIAYYFFPDSELNYDLLAKIRTRAAAYVIYADNCTLNEKFLDDKKITFKKIPSDVRRY